MTYLYDTLYQRIREANVAARRKDSRRDSLAASEGIVNGLIISLCIWTVGYFAYHIVRAALR